MVACDCCFDWYHNDCLVDTYKVNRESFNDEEKYRCPACNNWFNYKAKTMLPKLQEQVLDMTNLQDKARARMQIFDFIQLMIVMDQRIYLIDKQNKQSKKKGLKKTEEEFLEIRSQLSNLPLRASNIGIILEYFLEQYVHQSVEQAFSRLVQKMPDYNLKSIVIQKEGLEEVEWDQEKIKENENVMQQVQKMVEYLEGIGIQLKGNFQKQYRASVWLEKFQKWVKKEQNKKNEEVFTIQIAEELKKEYEKEEFEFEGEIQLLEKIIDQYYNWLEEIKVNIERVLENMQREKEKEDLMLERYQQQNILIPYYDYIRRKSEARMQRVQNKLTKEKVLELIREGSHILIDTSYEKKNLEKELEITENWEQQYQLSLGKKQEFDKCIDSMIKEIHISSPLMYEALKVYDQYENYVFRCHQIFEFLESQEEDMELERLKKVIDNFDDCLDGEDQEILDEDDERDDDSYSDLYDDCNGEYDWDEHNRRKLIQKK